MTAVLLISTPAYRPTLRALISATAPNDTIINVHDRMPVLLTDDEAMPWLHDTGMASTTLVALQPALERIAV